MTAALESFKGQIKRLSHEEVEELVRQLLRQKARLLLEPEIDDVEFVIAFLGSIMERIDLLSPDDRMKVAHFLQHRRAARKPLLTRRCIHCWSPLGE